MEWARTEHFALGALNADNRGARAFVDATGIDTLGPARRRTSLGTTAEFVVKRKLVARMGATEPRLLKEDGAR